MANYFPVYQKYFLLILLILFSAQPNTNQLFSQTTNAGKWYVDKNATGTNNGTSWINAWNSFASINWNNIKAGDTIFVSGGSTSKTYAASDGKGIRIAGKGVDGGNIIITKGRDVGHNGEVIFSATVTGYPNCSLYLDNNTKNIVLDNLTFKIETSDPMNAALAFGNGTHDCTVKNSHIISNGNGFGIGLSVVTKISILNNYIETLSNNYTTEQDGIIIGSGGGGHSITGNSIVLRGINPTPHKDIIQFHTNEGQHNMYVTTISNNFFSTTTNASALNGIYVNDVGSNRFEIFNNVVEVYSQGYANCFSIAQNSADTSYHLSVKLYNNTAITGGINNIPFYMSKMDTLVMKNNIIMKDSGSYAVVKFGYGLSKIKYKEIDYNQYFVRTGTAVVDTSIDKHITFAAFRNLGYETHGRYNEPTFVSKWKNHEAGDYKLVVGSSGINEGTPISLFNTDFEGTIRPQGAAWDRGAFEFKESSSNLDTTPPQLMGAAVINPTTIELTFSEALENSSALLKSNYSINNGIIVNSVSLSTDSKKVTLFTTTNSANQNYTVTVINIKDLAGNIISVNNNSAQYSYVGDTTPPNLLSAAVINPTTIELTFSEALENSSALVKTNYSINNGITVNNAVLSTDQKKVTLTTSQHIISQNYIVTVSNVKDLAGNNIAPNSSVQYSFVNNTVGNLKANVKIFLQGPYQNNIMTSELSGNELIPSTQPYNVAPWLYNGSESLSLPAGQAGSSTDWVLVELRSAQNPVQVISRRACLLRYDGRIIEPNGNLGVTFNSLLYGSYYIAVFHRNHLAVMTAVPVLFSPDNSLYDFTNALTKAYGQSAMTEMTTGIFGMYAGDGNGDGIVDDKDRNEVWSNQNGNLGYYNGDFNLDSGVTVKDINDYWNLNSGKRTQVP